MRKAFTLVELLTVIAIIALLISILLPALNKARLQARADLCMSNERQIALGFLFYAQEWHDCLPGGTNDYIKYGPGQPTYDNSTPLDWLGTLPTGSDTVHVPYVGTIFEYVARNEKAYKCPMDSLDKRSYHPPQWADKPLYSYTSPMILTGAPLTLLKATRWPASFVYWNPDTYWLRAAEFSLPWMIVEEDEAWYLAFVTDSGWSNNDVITDRHSGRGNIAYTDGSVSPRKFQRKPLLTDAWKVYYQLMDERWVKAGTWGDAVTFGYIRNAQRVNP
jgi:prepilin-type N-terminal cleavage/methylation domain-containing protein/prepilin-type processing-associated H-X9-DG protein